MYPNTRQILMKQSAFWQVVCEISHTKHFLLFNLISLSYLLIVLFLYSGEN